MPLTIHPNTSALVEHTTSNALIARVFPATSLAISNHNILDSSVVGTVVGTMSAVFGDGEVEPEWSLLNSAGGKYTIDPGTGIVTVDGALVVGTDTIVVQLTQGGKGATTASFSINVALEIVAANIIFVPAPISDLAAIGTVVGTASTTDGQSYVWSLAVNPGNRWTINPTTGVVRTATGLIADTDVIVIAITQGLKNYSQSFSIVVALPTITMMSLPLSTIYTSALAGTQVTKVVSTGTNLGSITYSIPSGHSAGGMFTIDADGTLRVGSVALTVGTQNIVITASPLGGIPVETSFTINIAIMAIWFESIRPLYSQAGFAFPINATVLEPVVYGSYGPYVWSLSSNPNNKFSINSTNGAVTTNYYGQVFTTGTIYPITVMVTDAFGNTETQAINVPTVSGEGIYAGQTVFWANSVWNWAKVGYTVAALTGSNFTISLNDPSGYFGADGYFTNEVVPPVGSYPVTVTATDGSNHSHTIVSSFVMLVMTSPAITNIAFTPSTVTTAWTTGMLVGRVLAGDPDNIYQWSVVSNPGNHFYIIANGGIPSQIPTEAIGNVYIAEPFTTAGNYSFAVQISDGNESYTQSFSVTVTAGTTISSSSMTYASLPLNLTNYSVISGSPLAIGTPVVSGMATGGTWSLWGTQGVRFRYTIDPVTGLVHAVVPLSFQPPANYFGNGNQDFSDVLTITYGVGGSTCTQSFTVPIAKISGPSRSVGPGLNYSAVDGNGRKLNFASLNDCLGDFFNNGWLPGAVITVYPSPDRTYYATDGFPDSTGIYYPGLRCPLTIQGAPGQVMPYFSGAWSRIGAGNQKGLFSVDGYDLFLKNLEFGAVWGEDLGQGTPNVSAVIMDALTGNLFMDNCFVHDCDDGIRGVSNANLYMTNCRVSQCGIGETGYDHNIYTAGDFTYFYNLLSDTATVGHTLKTRASQTTVVNSRFYDGEYGYSSCHLDNFQGGITNISNTVFHFGPNAQNPDTVHLAGSDAQNSLYANGSNATNIATLSNNTFMLSAVDGTSFDNPASGDVGILQGGLPGGFDGLAPVLNLSNNTFYGYQPGNYVQNIIYVAPNVTGITGVVNGTETNITGTGLQPELDYSFPGTAIDPVIAAPLPPIVRAYGSWFGPQITIPMDDIRISAGNSIGATVVTPNWIPPGNEGTGVLTNTVAPVWRITFNAGGRYAIDSATGKITIAATLLPNTVDVITISVNVLGSSYSQWGYDQSAPKYYTYVDNNGQTAFSHEIYIVVLPTGQINLLTLSDSPVVAPGSATINVTFNATLIGYSSAPSFSYSIDKGNTWTPLTGATITTSAVSFWLPLAGGSYRLLLKDQTGVISNPMVFSVKSATIGNIPASAKHNVVLPQTAASRQSMPNGIPAGASIIAGVNVSFRGLRQVYVAMHTAGSDEGERVAFNMSTLMAINLTPANIGSYTVRVYDDWINGNLLAESVVISVS